ncbi:MAG: hypothetical protein M1828_006951 [Chrysothrix sp. TS-e1954]|nr:MAG: hypothetical protein M1828_006951 [Chrysothrix sp. TS-e1954]
MAEVESTILNHYNLTTPFPTAWPAEKDESDESADEKPAPAVTTRPRAKSMRRYTTLGKSTKSSRTSVPGSQKKDGVETMVQKDEPDPLGGSGSVVSRLRQRGLPVEEDLKLRNRFLLSSTSFSPSMYLSEVHNTASTDQLLRGLDVLSRSIEQKSASLKVLVESNFERFVRAKATIDNVYTEMRNHGADEVPAQKPHSRHSSRQMSHMRSSSAALDSPAQPQYTKRSFALVKESEYGIMGVKNPLTEVNVKAEEVWGPSLGGQAREENLKSVLASIEQYRNVFDTGVAIEDCIKRRDYETLADEYGRAQRYAKEAKALADQAKQGRTELSDSQMHQIIMTARVWLDIESKVTDFKRDTWRQLTSSHFGKQASMSDAKGDEYMELIGLLLQLGTDDNPIWIWLLSRYEYLRNRVWGSFERVRLELEVQRRRIQNGKKPTAKQLARHLKTAAGTRPAQEDEAMDTPQVLEYWEKVLISVDALLSTKTGVLGEVTEFWEIGQSFVSGSRQQSLPTGIDGQSRKHHRLSEDNIKALQQGALDLFGLIREQVYGLFVEPPLDDVSALFSPGPPPTPKTPMTPMTPMSAILSPTKASRFNFDPKDIPPPSPSTGEAWEKYAFWPPYSNCLSAVTYLSKITNAIGVAAAEIATVRIVKQESRLIHQYRSLVGDIRERSITAICAAWLIDSENCRELEDWTHSADKPDHTLMPSLFSAFETALLTNLQKIVYISDAANSTGSADVVLPPAARHIETVQKGFKHSLYKAFSGMMEYAAKPTSSTDVTGEESLTLPSSQDQQLSSRDKVGAIDASSKNVRKILTISNFQALRNDIVPTLVSTFESNFLLTISDDAKTARDVLSQMNARVFQAYVRQPVENLRAVISDGIASPSYAPKDANNTRPDDARPYVYEVLLTLVLVHTEVSRTAPGLTGQVLSYLLEQLSTAMSDAFKLRPKYTLSSLMQATLDVEFLAQTLGNYTTAKAGEIQSGIYLALDERTDNEARAKLQSGLPEMRATLKRLRERTQGEFGCFRRQKSGGSRDKNKGGGER